MSSYTAYLAAATAAFSLISSATAGTYDVNSKSNVALYWGQGANQAILRTYCAQPSVDIIPIAFVNQFANTGDGILGENFGSACWAGSYPGPGYDGVINRTADALPERCIDLQNDIPYCQANYDTKILISIGGAVGENLAAYGLGNETQGIALAEMLWYGYGPYNVTASGVLGDGTQGLGFIRPLDRGYNNTNYTEHVDVDGFDFDIETNSADEQLGYVACINHLRKLIGIYQTAYPGSKDYIISGAPQCPIPDAHMDVIIAQAQFDIIWVQFYNNDAYGCSARNYITSGTNSNFNLNSGATNWTSTLAQSLHSKDAKLYIGLPGGPAGVTNNPQDFLTPSEAQTLISAFVGTTNFGGVMLWEATAAEEVDMASYPAPYNTYAHYYDAIKGILAPYAPVTSSVVSSTTSTSSSASSTVVFTTTTSSSSITTSSSSVPTSTSASSTTTTSSSISISSSGSVSASSTSSVLSTTSSSSSMSSTISSSSSVAASSSISSSATMSSSSGSVSVSRSASLSSSSATLSSSASGSSSSIVTPTSSASGSATSVSSSASSSSLVYSNSTATVPSSSKSKTKTKCSSVYPTSSGKVVLPTSSSTSIVPISSGTGLVTPTSSAGGVATSPSVSTTLFTTSTVYATSTYTITSCAATVTDCPARIGQVTTETIVDYTTICPVTESTKTAIPATTYSALAPPPTQYTTSTVYATSIYTITSCAATVTDCPARIGQVTTEVVKLYTTICPVAEAAATASSSPAGPGKIVAASSSSSPTIAAAPSPAPSGSSRIIHTTIKSTTTLYKTVKMVESTATVMAVPYPTGSSASGKPFGTGLPSVSLVFKGEATSSAAGVAATTSPITPASTTGTKFTGAGSREGVEFGTVLAVVLGVGAFLV